MLFGERHLEMWAVGAGAAYHLHLPRLYGRLIPQKCRAKVNQVGPLSVLPAWWSACVRCCRESAAWACRM